MTPFLAHVGGRSDLPVPLSFFIVGAGVAIVVSFVALSVSWTQPRLQADYRRTTARRPERAYAILGGLGAAGALLVITDGVVDGGYSPRNIATLLVWIVFWLVIPFASLLVGGLWPAISPFRRVVGALAAGRPERPRWGELVGVWPATVGFTAFVWLELVYSANTTAQTLSLAVLCYGVYLVAAGLLLGPNTALESGEAFEVYTGVISAMAPLELHYPDRPERRRWFAALPHLPRRRGLTAFIVAMIGTVSYDGMSTSGWWRDLVGDRARDMWFETAALLASIAVIGALYYAASVAAARLAGTGRRAADVAASFAHTLVPIAFAYAFAHYFTLVVFEGQQLVHAASDPFSRGWDLFGTAEWQIVFTPSQDWVWYVQVMVIVLGHIGGVVLAHDRALAEFPPGVAVRTQYAMLVLMVSLTGLGLFILAG